MQEDEFYEQLKSYGKDLLNKEQFTKTPAWFDKDEETQIELSRTKFFQSLKIFLLLLFYQIQIYSIDLGILKNSFFTFTKTLRL